MNLHFSFVIFHLLGRNKKLGDVANHFVISSALSRIHKESRILFEHYHKHSEIFVKKSQVPENDEYPKISNFQF